MMLKTRYAKSALAAPVRAAALFIMMALGIPANAPAFAQVSGQGTPRKVVPQHPDSARQGETLSERLDRSKGVIRPPSGIDPKIHKPAPTPNPKTTPVIPPPGTPGGDQSVQPK
jgi:hypothetical protein